MRLIRLTTESEECVFENSQFNSDLIIKPYSQIALSSFTTQLDNLNLTIDSQNNEISFTVNGDANFKRLTLPNGVYTSATVNDFWVTTTQLFNKSMLFAQRELNRQWYCGIRGGRAVFEATYGSLVFPKNALIGPLYSSVGLTNTNLVSGAFKRTTVGTGNDSYLYIKSPVNKGSGFLRARLFNDEVAGTASGFILGYSASNPPVSTNPVPFDPTTIIYGVKYTKLGDNYFIIKDGVATDSGINAVVNDTIEIQTVGGVVNFYVYRGSEPFNIEVLGDSTYNHMDDIFPITMFIGSDTQLSNINFTTDPYYDRINYPSGEIEANNPGIIIIAANGYTTNCYLQFDNPDLATLLGFRQSRYPSAGFINTANPMFLANEPFTLRDFSESYIVELLNIKLNSMDSMSGGLRSFLYVIPQLSAIKEHVVYQVPQLIFLDINNTYEINLREVKARVLKDNLSKITCYGLSELVMIIREKGE
jgi:hypothetical protein